ncbi:MAG TPA: carboxypeptidase-like regulatory domain-containing protein [Longimicrobium sp.]
MKRPVSFALLAVALAAAPLAAQDRVVVTGRVVDAASGTPLAAAALDVAGSSAGVLADRDGRFELHLRPGSYGIMVSRMGYETLLVTLEAAGRSADLGTIALKADPVMLEALEVTVDRIERQRLSVAASSRVFGVEELSNTAAFNAADFVRMRSGLSYTSSFRGGPAGTCVVVDDAPLPGGLRTLEIYQPRDFARINVYRRGAFVQAYTPAYLERLAKQKFHPMPASVQMIAYCRMNTI